MDVPADLKYTRDHEWARAEGDGVRVGITDFAQDALGDVVFVQLPAVGSRVEARQLRGEVESTKSVSELYAPISGVVAEVNTDLETSPEQMNADPYGAGWICLITPADPSELGALLDPGSYGELTAG